MNVSRFGLALVVVALIATSCTSQSSPETTSSAVSATATVAPQDSTTSTVSAGEPPDTTAPTEPTTTTMSLDETTLRLVEMDIGFDSPVLYVASPDAGADLVVEQPGRIVRADGGDHEVVLDIRGEVIFDGEMGLLGFAVHPRFDENGLVYVNYVGPGPTTVISSFVLSNGVIDPSTQQVILTVAQPAGNHNGGMIAFGPADFLWVGMGDGGRSNDAFGNGQNPDTLLGSMLRIAVDPLVEGYGIPDDNPFWQDEGGGRMEVWATGLRNPWRFAFDGNDVWIADVGQERIEEINVVDAFEPGLNYGWNIMEGSECFQQSSCDTDGLVIPITEYAQPAGCSVTGGTVYRGDAVPSLRGQFFFADYCSGLFRSVDKAGNEYDWTDQMNVDGNVTGFGNGSDGETYLVTRQGTLYRIEAGTNG